VLCLDNHVLANKKARTLLCTEYELKTLLVSSKDLAGSMSLLVIYRKKEKPTPWFI
jgi:hypothetical protein